MAEKQPKETLLKEHLYGDLLAPEPGYETDFALGMTYSLGFDALLTAYLAFGMLDDVNNDALSKQHVLLGAIADSSEKVVIFCNKGGIAVPADIQKVHSLLERNIYEVFDKHNVHANFHPKLWLIREVSKESNETLIKLIVTSRNLKFTDTQDCIVCLTGKVNKSITDNEKHRPLADFVIDVAKCSNLMAASDEEKRKKMRAIKSLVKDLMKVEFEISDPFVEYDFVPYFFNSFKKSEGLKPKDLQRERAIIVSPFITYETLKELRPRDKHNSALITRREYVNQDILDMFKQSGEQDLYNVFVCNDELAAQGMDLHAKMYYIESSGADRYLLLGSANATHSAFNRNGEFLLRLKYNGGYNHRKNFLSGFYSEEDSRFVRMTKEDLMEQDKLTAAEETDKEIEKLLKELMCREDLKAEIIGPYKGKYSIKVETGKTKPSADKGIAIQLAPLQKAGLQKSWANEIVFKELCAEELSEFFLISAARDGRHHEKIIKIPTANMPDKRDNAIYKSIIGRSEDFFAIVELILTGCPLNSLIGSKADKKSTNGKEDGNDKISYYGLYESLLRTAATEPEKITKVQELADRLDEKVVPEDFRKLIKHFAEAIN